MENMQWGLIPHWMKRQPDYASALKTINARDDTILEGGSMWKSIRGRKRCIVIAEGFYEWLKKSPSDKVPHHVKRKDGQLMCFAGLWDSVTYEGEEKMEPLHTYTIITTNSNKQLEFLHDRMPVILTTPEEMRLWLDTSNQEWTPELAALLKPFEGKLECYPVPKEVGKVGQQSADFLKPVSERKGNISSFFSKPASSPKKSGSPDNKAKSGSPAAKAQDEDDYQKKDETEDDYQKKDEKEDVPQELALNPDDDDKIKTVPADEEKDEKKTSKDEVVVLDDAHKEETKAKSESKGKQMDEIIVLDDTIESADNKPAPSSKPSSKKKQKQTGKAQEPILLDESDSEDGGAKADKSAKKAEPKDSASKKRKKSNSLSASPPRKATKTQDHESPDEQGNEKLTNFFEVKDDSD